ncbi:hypothetical protein [Paenibacillus sp. HJGM_3]|uniref:hypothetical protein n=1 Tax=Paenibacillus sp. HJGM_3 TaxID=3379816 RepID=UPI0038593073
MEFSMDFSALFWFIAGVAWLVGGACVLLPSRKESHRSVQPSRTATPVPDRAWFPISPGRRIFRRKQPGVRDSRSDEEAASDTNASARFVTKSFRKGESTDVYMVSLYIRHPRSAALRPSCVNT